jgi:hypothetical protein
MKKLLLPVMAAIILVTTLGFRTGSAAAAGLISYVDGHYVWGKGIVFVFTAAGHRNKDVRGANIFVGSNFHKLGCTVDKEKENIVCVLGGGFTQYAGQTGIIYLGGQVFYVTIPDRTIAEPTVVVEPPLVCEEPEVMGATVVFRDSDHLSYPQFVPGNTVEEVEALADSWVDGEFWVSHDPVGDLECGMPPQ